jgi:hypothetical protein
MLNLDRIRESGDNFGGSQQPKQGQRKKGTSMA